MSVVDLEMGISPPTWSALSWGRRRQWSSDHFSQKALGIVYVPLLREAHASVLRQEPSRCLGRPPESTTLKDVEECMLLSAELSAPRGSLPRRLRESEWRGHLVWRLRPR